LGLSAGFAAAQKPGKGGGGGGSVPTLPPVRYQLKTFRMPNDSCISVSVGSMNNSGIVVGYYGTSADTLRHPFLYDPSIDPDVALDLNTLDIDWHEPGWRLASALGVNESGYVVGQMEEFAQPGVWRGYVLDLNVSPAVLVPLSTGTASNWARRINDNLDVVGVAAAEEGYHIYVCNVADEAFTDLGILGTSGVELSNPPPGEPAQVVGEFWGSWTVFRYIVGAGFDESVTPFPGRALRIASNGDFCGNYDQFNKGGKNVTYRPMRYRGSLEIFSDLQGYASGINTHGDIVTWNTQQLYHEGTGLINLNSVVVGIASDLAIWDGSWARCLPDMTERGALNPGMPNYPGICVWLAGSQFGPRGALLVPVEP
ncbi:MAG: hypothetical protein KJZ78_24425, partial [Bryobacteraceae bacterium]|nr:hypothetical protein [Bryobacteraceae bacterium]